MRKLDSFKTIGANSLNEWHKIRNPFRVIFNFILIFVSRYSPSLALKRFLLRLTGMKIERNVSIALMVNFDVFWPELISIKENSIIGFNATILAHEFLIKEYRTGKVEIGRNVLIGANSTVLPGVRIGDNSVVSAMSLVNKSVPRNSFYGGIPIKKLR